jgi:DNA-binding transcriptional MerR regulator
MVPKSPDAFRTISEVSDGLGVPQHVLRFWETKFPSIKPLKRGGNRRYYRPEDVALLQSINRLLYSDGYTIKGVQKLLKDRGAKDLSVAAPVEAVVAPVDRTAELRAIRDSLVTALAA